MHFLLFLTPNSIFPHHHHSKATIGSKLKCSRRPRSIRFPIPPIASLNDSSDTTAESDESNDNVSRQIGEPSWMNLARDLVPDAVESDSSTAREEPKWQYPAGYEGPDDSGKDGAAWRMWQNAVDKTEEDAVEPRDIKAETDFWRNAARDITPSTDANQSQETSTSPQFSNYDYNDVTLEKNSDGQSREQIWGMARGVTGKISDLQDQLRVELEGYNPEENTDQYRDIAREIVQPSVDELENGEDTIKNTYSKSNDDIGADPGSGWNPDIDWMRYDDVRREQEKKSQKNDLRIAEQNARDLQQEAINKLNASTQQDFDETGGLQDETGKTIFPTYTDQSTSESRLSTNDSNQLPGFIKNRYRQRGTYGPSSTGAEEEAVTLKEEGIPLKDPKADATAWRSVARELNLDVGTDTDLELEDGQQLQLDRDSEESDATNQSESSEASTYMESNPANPTVPDETEVSLGSDTAKQSWSTWRSSSTNWEIANQNVEPRDPKKEVDMWRSNARELTANIAPEDKQQNPSLQNTSTSETNLWENYRRANENWKSSLGRKTATSGGLEEGNPSRWRSTESFESDWGASFDSKTTSDKAAWENWNNVAGQDIREGARLWWETKSNVSDTETSRKDSNVNDFMSDDFLAKASGNVQKSRQPTALPKRNERLNTDPSLQSWKSIARELADEKPETSVTEGDPEHKKE